MKNPIYISFHGFWPRFFEDEQNNISFFKELFSDVSKQLIIQNDPNISDILVSTYGCEMKKRDNAINILYIAEPSNNKEGFDLVIAGIDENKYNFRVINIPLFISYLYCNNFLDKCINKETISKVPTKFCCFIISNPNAKERNTIFHLLNSYKNVDSTGLALNNTNYLLTCPYGSQEFFNYISQYKFIICGENTKMENYITEKIFHGYLSNSIPIYYGSDYSKKIFHPNSYLYLEDTTNESFMKLLNEVIDIDNNNTRWLEMVNSPVFINNTLPVELQMDTLKCKVKNHINEIYKFKTKDV